MGHLKQKQRGGFTLIELLTVITIISLMASLLIGASYRFVVSTRETATATTVMKASGIIQDRIRAFQEFDFRQVANQLTPKVGSRNLAEILARKERFKRAFPQTFLELDSSQITRFFGIASLPTGSPYDPKFESGIVLYAVLVKGETFGAPTPGDDTFVSAEIKNGPETGGLPCLVDAWGEPLRFYRWPTRLIRCGEQGIADYNNNGSSNDPPGTIDLTSGVMQASPAIRPTGNLNGPTPASLLIQNLPTFDISNPFSNGSDGAPGVLGESPPLNTLGWPNSDDPEYLNTDPDDPTMRLLNIPTALAAFVVGSEPDPTNTFMADAYHDPFTFTSPLIVSAGPDRQLGLYEPSDIPTPTYPRSQNFGYLANPLPLPASVQLIFDDISNLNQRSGGK